MQKHNACNSKCSSNAHPLTWCWTMSDIRTLQSPGLVPSLLPADNSDTVILVSKSLQNIIEILPISIFFYSQALNSDFLINDIIEITYMTCTFKKSFKNYKTKQILYNYIPKPFTITYGFVAICCISTSLLTDVTLYPPLISWEISYIVSAIV